MKEGPYYGSYRQWRIIKEYFEHGYTTKFKSLGEMEESFERQKPQKLI